MGDLFCFVVTTALTVGKSRPKLSAYALRARYANSGQWSVVSYQL
ncbi:hypothetical protein [Moorena sp. SIO1F2]|nr:hypothetical protein [Moorena sp. SIO1F2]